MVRLLELTRDSHAKYGDPLFHLEPNIKDCPGGLRDLHVCRWMTKLQEVAAQAKKKDNDGAAAAVLVEEGNEFRKAVEFLWLVRCFLHYRHERGDNTLDWQAQGAAGGTEGGVSGGKTKKGGSAYWVRGY